jgi:hypothetical protein
MRRLCAFSTIVFLALASVSKLRLDLERDETAGVARMVTISITAKACCSPKREFTL